MNIEDDIDHNTKYRCNRCCKSDLRQASTAPEYVVFEGPGMDAFAESPEWGGALVIFPYMYYETYGDDSLIKKYYQNMRRYVDYLSTRADNHILSEQRFYQL